MQKRQHLYNRNPNISREKNYCREDIFFFLKVRTFKERLILEGYIGRINQADIGKLNTY